MAHHRDTEDTEGSSSSRTHDIVGAAIEVHRQLGVRKVLPIHRAQVLTYLKLTKYRLGLLINFNVEVLRSGLYRIING
jgi:hypothetical protein